MFTKNFDRRKFIRRAFTISGAAVTAHWVAPRFGMAADSKIVYAGWGGDYQQHIMDSFAVPFTAETGVTVLPVASPGNMVPIIKSQVDSDNPEWDIVEVVEPEAYTLRQGGYLSEITYDPAITAQFPEGRLIDVAAPAVYAAFVLAWNTEMVPNPPQNWADFFNVKDFPGPRSACGWYPYYMVEIALMADGIPVDEVYPMTEEKLEIAFAKLKEFQPHVNVWWGSGSQSAQLFADGEVAMGMLYENRIREAVNAGAPVDWTLNQAIVENTLFVIPTSSKNKEAANQFINVSLRPENQAAMVRTNHYGATNPAAYDLLTEEEKVRNIGNPTNLQRELILDGKYWADVYPKYIEAWEALKAGS